MSGSNLSDSSLSASDLLKLAVPSAVAGAIAYEVMYFLGLGIGISNAPLSPSDFLNGWKEWGSVGIYFFLGVLLHVIFSRIENWKSEDEIVRNSPNPKWIKKFRDSPLFLFFLITFLAGASFLAIGEANLALAQPAIFIFLILAVAWLSRGSHFEKELGKRSIHLMLGTLFTCSITGFMQGTRVLDQQENIKSITFVDGSRNSVIRIFDQWTLTRIDKKRLAWVSNQTERVIEFEPNRSRFIGAYCFYQWHINSQKPGHCSKYW